MVTFIEDVGYIIQQMNQKVIAVAAVAVIIVAAVAAVLLLNSDNNESHAEVEASLYICGNANGDSVIDDQDLTTIREIINGNLSKYDHHLADANNDGHVNEADYSFVESMISKTNDYVWVLDNADNYVKVDYPITKSVIVGTNPITTALQIGAIDYILGYSSTSYPEIHSLLIENSRMLGGTITDLNTDEALANFMELDRECGGLQVVIALPSYLRTSADFISDAGIPILRLDTRYGEQSISGALTLGYIYGEETEKKSQEFAQLTYDVLDYIDQKVGNISESERTTYLSVASGNYIGQLDSVYNNVCNIAGGSPVANIPGTAAEQIEIGSEGYLNYHPDNIISFRTLDYSIDWVHAVTGAVTTPQDTWNNYKAYWENMDCYENLVYINLSMPVAVQVAYIAEIFYPNLFEDGYGDSINQQFVDSFMSYLGDDFDVSTDMTSIITYDMIYG